jgi:hypothetical protein
MTVKRQALLSSLTASSLFLLVSGCGDDVADDILDGGIVDTDTDDTDDGQPDDTDDGQPGDIDDGQPGDTDAGSSAGRNISSTTDRA